MSWIGRMWQVLKTAAIVIEQLYTLLAVFFILIFLMILFWFVSVEQRSQSPLLVMVGIFVVGVAVLWGSWAIISRIKRQKWKRAGKQANLTPEGGETPTGELDVGGTVRGRPVRARTVKHKISTGEGFHVTTTTIVETDLDQPSEQGLVVALDGGEIIGDGPSLYVHKDADAMAQAGFAVHREGELTVVGQDEAVARAMATGRSGDVLRSFEANMVYIGDAAGLVNRWLRDPYPGGSGLWQKLIVGIGKISRREGMFDDTITGDGSTVSLEAHRLITDGEQLREWTQSLVEIAEEYERATAGR